MVLESKLAAKKGEMQRFCAHEAAHLQHYDHDSPGYFDTAEYRKQQATIRGEQTRAISSRSSLAE